MSLGTSPSVLRDRIGRIIRAQFNIVPISEWERLPTQHKETWRREADTFMARCWAAGIRLEVAHEAYQRPTQIGAAGGKDREALLSNR